MPPDSVGKCPPGFSEEVEARAVEVVNEARESVRRGMHVNTTHGYREQENFAIVDRLAPVIAEAAYRAGIEDARTKVIGLHAKGVSRILAALAALTDTEGRGPGSIEGRQEPPAATTDSVVNTNPEGGEN